MKFKFRLGSVRRYQSNSVEIVDCKHIEGIYDYNLYKVKFEDSTTEWVNERYLK